MLVMIISEEGQHKDGWKCVLLVQLCLMDKVLTDDVEETTTEGI